jgi:hypothetical protein
MTHRDVEDWVLRRLITVQAFSGVVSSFVDPAGTWAWRLVPAVRRAAEAPVLPRVEAAAVRLRVAEGAAEAPLRAEAVVWLGAVAPAARPAASADGPLWSATVSVALSDRCWASCHRPW